MSNEGRRWEGGCYCSAVRYAIRGPEKFVAHDHCSICRRIAGAAFVTWVGVLQGQFELLAGESSLATFGSSPEATRQFCSRCGSHLFFRSTRWPGEVHVTMASLDSTEGLAPKAPVYFSDRATWCVDGDGLPRFGGETGMEPLLPTD